MEPIVGLVLFGILFVAVYVIGRWILGPIDRAAKERQAPVRVSIGDLLCLFVVVQLPLAFVSRLRSDDTEVYFWLFSFLAWVVAPIIWIACAMALSRAGITQGKHRLAFMGLVLPIVYYGLTPFVVLAVVGCLSLCFDDSVELIREGWWLMLGWVLLGIALFVCGRYTHWLVQQTAGRLIAGDADRLPPDSNSERLHDSSGR